MTTRYFVGPGKSRIAWTRIAHIELVWLLRHGYTEVDRTAYEALTKEGG